MKWYVVATGIFAALLACLYGAGSLLTEDPSRSSAWGLIAILNASMAIAMAHNVRRATNNA